MREIRGTRIIARKDAEGSLEIFDDGLTRNLHFGNAARQSSLLLCSPSVLVHDYTRAMMAALLFNPEPRKVLLLGLGGGTLTHFLVHFFPNCCIDAVERRPAVVALAREFFALPAEPQLTVHVQDAADFVCAAQPESYDLILVDLFDSDGMADLLESLEFFRQCRGLMTGNGVLALNLWTGPGHPNQTVLKNVYAAFDHPALEMPVKARGNMIALVTHNPVSTHDLKNYRNRARALGNHFGLELPNLLNTLIRNNPHNRWQQKVK